MWNFISMHQSCDIVGRLGERKGGGWAVRPAINYLMVADKWAALTH